MQKTYLILPVISTLVIGTMPSTTVSGVKFLGDYSRPNAYTSVVDHTKVSIALFNRMIPIERYKVYIIAQTGLILQDNFGFSVIFHQDSNYLIMNSFNSSLPWDDFYSHVNKILASGADPKINCTLDLIPSETASSSQDLASLLTRHNLPYAWTLDGKIHALGWQKHHVHAFNTIKNEVPWVSSTKIKEITLAAPVQDPAFLYAINNNIVPLNYFMKSIGSLPSNPWAMQHFK